MCCLTGSSAITQRPALIYITIADANDTVAGRISYAYFHCPAEEVTWTEVAVLYAELPLRNLAREVQQLQVPSPPWYVLRQV